MIIYKYLERFHAFVFHTLKVDDLYCQDPHIIRINCYTVIHYCMMIIIIKSNDNNTCDHLLIFQYIQNIFHTFAFHTLKVDLYCQGPKSIT